MKYKRIPSVLHNFAHSFMSMMNTTDEVQYVEDILHWLAVNAPGKTVTINFSTGVITPERAARVQPLQVSVAQWQEDLPRQFLSQRVDPARLRDITLTVHMPSIGLEGDRADVSIEALDDRGRRYRVELPSWFPFLQGFLLPNFDDQGW